MTSPPGPRPMAAGRGLVMWALMGARRFAPLFWCQFLSAFNDNYVRQMLALMILFRFGGQDAGAKIQLAVALFVLPAITPRPNKAT